MQAVLGRLRIEDCGVTERELPRVHVVRVLVQQESKVSRRLVGRSDGQEHELAGSQGRHPVYRDVTSSPPRSRRQTRASSSAVSG